MWKTQSSSASCCRRSSWKTRGYPPPQMGPSPDQGCSYKPASTGQGFIGSACHHNNWPGEKYIHTLPVNVTALQVDLLVDGIPQFWPQRVEFLPHCWEQAAVHRVSHLWKSLTLTQRSSSAQPELLDMETFGPGQAGDRTLTQLRLDSRLNSWARAALKS